MNILKEISQILMFIPFLKLLVADTDSGEIARIEKILKDNDIMYRIKTASSRGRIGRFYDSSSFKSYNVGFNRVGYQIDVNFLIYVRKKDLERARKLID
ncbi:MAG: hypothetical protein ACOYKC_02385 [Anaerolineaceae bacterium]|jgi:hypothetical protein